MVRYDYDDKNLGVKHLERKSRTTQIVNSFRDCGLVDATLRRKRCTVDLSKPFDAVERFGVKGINILPQLVLCWVESMSPFSQFTL